MGVFAVTAPTSVLYFDPDLLAISRGSYRHFALPPGSRSYPAGVLCTSHTVPASQPAERRTSGRVGPPLEWACRPRHQISALPHAGRSWPMLHKKFLPCLVPYGFRGSMLEIAMKWPPFICAISSC